MPAATPARALTASGTKCLPAFHSHPLGKPTRPPVVAVPVARAAGRRRPSPTTAAGRCLRVASPAERAFQRVGAERAFQRAAVTGRPPGRSTPATFRAPDL